MTDLDIIGDSGLAPASDDAEPRTDITLSTQKYIHRHESVSPELVEVSENRFAVPAREQTKQEKQKTWRHLINALVLGASLFVAAKYPSVGKAGVFTGLGGVFLLNVAPSLGRLLDALARRIDRSAPAED